jgi:hypothetical protein
VFRVVVIPRYTVMPEECEKLIAVLFEAPFQLECVFAAIFSERYFFVKAIMSEPLGLLSL